MRSPNKKWPPTAFCHYFHNHSEFWDQNFYTSLPSTSVGYVGYISCSFHSCIFSSQILFPFFHLNMLAIVCKILAPRRQEKAAIKMHIMNSDQLLNNCLHLQLRSLMWYWNGISVTWNVQNVLQPWACMPGDICESSEQPLLLASEEGHSSLSALCCEAPQNHIISVIQFVKSSSTGNSIILWILNKSTATILTLAVITHPPDGVS